MNSAPSECIVFTPGHLLPDAWLALAGTAPVRTFNPALLRDGDGWLLAYRVVLADGRRRLALCRLDRDRQIIADSAAPLSDQVRFANIDAYPEIARQWLADPRIYRLGDRVFIYWNSGWHEPRNYQFLQELDPRSLLPVGAPRELILRGERRPLEKNWTLFQAPDGALHAVYSITPHRVLRLSVAGEGDISCDDAATTTWATPAYPPSHGGLRGGAPPVWHEGIYWSFCHSVHDGADGYNYSAAVYGFGPGPDFAPVFEPTQPLELARAARKTRAHPRLNPAVGEVIYPCGAAHDGTRWWVSHGINDEQCALSPVSDAEVQACVRPCK